MPAKEIILLLERNELTSLAHQRIKTELSNTSLTTSMSPVTPTLLLESLTSHNRLHHTNTTNTIITTYKTDCYLPLSPI